MSRDCIPRKLGYCSRMIDLKLEVPVFEEVEVDAKILAAIDPCIADADARRVVPLDEVRKLLPQWISKFESPKPRSPILHLQHGSRELAI